MDVSQVTGSTSSYARKYALNGLFCIDDVKDADNQNNASGGTGKGTSKGSRKNDTRKVQGQAGKVTEAMIRTLQSMTERYSAKGLKMDKILSMYKLTAITDMDTEQYKYCMEKLKLYEKEGGAKE